MIIKDANVTIMVNDMDKSISFYQSIGFTIKNRWGNHYAQLVAPGITIGLHPRAEGIPATANDNISIGFTADNFEEAKSLLEAASIASTARSEEGRQFLHFNDPDGTALYFIKPKW